MSDINKDINELTPDFKEKVDKFISHCHMLGYPIFVTEGYRTQERQNELYGYARTEEEMVEVGLSRDLARPDIERPVTWTLNSLHTQRIACDIAFDGDELYPSDLDIWKAVAQIANGYGIEWGYDLWGTDLPHFQSDGEPLQDIEQLIPYGMNDKQKKVLELNIDVCGNSYDHGTDKQKTLAEKQAAELRDLLINV